MKGNQQRLRRRPQGPRPRTPSSAVVVVDESTRSLEEYYLQNQPLGFLDTEVTDKLMTSEADDVHLPYVATIKQETRDHYQDRQRRRYGILPTMTAENSGLSSLFDPGMTSSESSNTETSARDHTTASKNDICSVLDLSFVSAEASQGHTITASPRIKPVDGLVPAPLQCTPTDSPVLPLQLSSPLVFAAPFPSPLASVYERRVRPSSAPGPQGSHKPLRAHHSIRPTRSNTTRPKSDHPQATPARPPPTRIPETQPTSYAIPWPYDLRGLYEPHPDVPVTPRPQPASPAPKGLLMVASKVVQKVGRVWNGKNAPCATKPVSRHMRNSEIPHPPWDGFGFRSDDDTLHSDDEDGDLELWLAKATRKHLSRSAFANGLTIEQYERVGSWVAQKPPRRHRRTEARRKTPICANQAQAISSSRSGSPPPQHAKAHFPPTNPVEIPLSQRYESSQDAQKLELLLASRSIRSDQLYPHLGSTATQAQCGGSNAASRHTFNCGSPKAPKPLAQAQSPNGPPNDSNVDLAHEREMLEGQEPQGLWGHSGGPFEIGLPPEELVPTCRASLSSLHGTDSFGNLVARSSGTKGGGRQSSKERVWFAN